MLNLEEQLRLHQALLRAENVARELSDIVRLDGVLFKKVSRRTKRWIVKQDAIRRKEEDIRDEEALRIRKRQKALDKLTKEDKDLLGIKYEEDEDFT